MKKPPNIPEVLKSLWLYLKNAGANSKSVHANQFAKVSYKQACLNRAK